MILPNLSEERNLWQKGFKHVAGVDEVGRGAWAGPLVAAAVIFSPQTKPPTNLKDSKLLSAKLRQELSFWIKENALACSVSVQSHQIINNYGIVSATGRAFRAAIKNLPRCGSWPDFVLVDAFQIRYFPKTKQQAIIKGDQKVVSIAAASILAKVYRDKLMANKYHHLYPKYHFYSHKGYGTARHQEAIRRFGLCKIHRTQFVPERLRLCPMPNQTYP